ncbi:MAG: tetratricopeptide repeat protein, partial [Pseudomonadota bacterium]
GQTVAQNDLLSFSRGQEQAADQAGVSYLRAVGVSSAGLGEFFRILDEQNLLAASRGNAYLRTHPLTRDRIRFVESQVTPLESGDPGYPQAWAPRHERMVAKLEAFLSDPSRVLQKATGDSLTDRYRRAIALYRLPDLDNAVAEIDGLIEDHPDDPYFHELKGQMLFENGRIERAIAPYRDAVRLKPAPLLKIGLARALIESGDREAGLEAIEHLKASVRAEPRNAGAWRMLGIAQGRAGEEGEASLSLAEWALLTGKEDDAKLHARRAENRIGPSDPGWLQLQDILRAIEES